MIGSIPSYTTIEAKRKASLRGDAKHYQLHSRKWRYVMPSGPLITPSCNTSIRFGGMSGVHSLTPSGTQESVRKGEVYTGLVVVQRVGTHDWGAAIPRECIRALRLCGDQRGGPAEPRNSAAGAVYRNSRSKAFWGRVQLCTPASGEEEK